MNQEILITDFLKRLSFRTVESTLKRYSFDHTALALITRMPSNIPIGKQVYLNLVKDTEFEYLVQFDIEAVRSVPGWFFVRRTITS